MSVPRRIWALLTVGLLLLSTVVAGVILGGNPQSVKAAGTIPARYFAPYIDIMMNGASLKNAVDGSGQKFYTLAFMNGNGCDAQWGSAVALDKTDIYLPNLDSDIAYVRASGGEMILAFGGAAGNELGQFCTTASSLQTQYQRVIDKYHFNFFDFDLEEGEQGNATHYDRRNIALAALQAANPGLRISFTLPSATSGLLDDSLGMLRNAVSHGVNISIVNLMTMDYGSANSQMGQSAISAANGLYSELQAIYPSKSASQLWAMVGITPMIGQNDSAGEVFSLANANEVLNFANQKQIGELAFWSVGRDNGGCPGAGSASNSCSGVSQGPYAFTNIFKSFGGTVTNPTPTATSSKTATPTPTKTSTPTPTPTVTTTPIPGNRVSNPGFETGTLANWSCQSGSVVVGSPVHSGSSALQVTPTGLATGECTQTVSVQANHAYTLSAYVNGPYAYLGVQGGASSWTTSSSYTKLSVSFTTTASQTSITIYLHGWYAQGNIYADDFVLS